MTRRLVQLEINGKPYEGSADPRRLLVDFIRDDLGLTGTHVGCEHGVCGACTILMDGEAVRACLLFAVQTDGAKLTTVEGLANGSELNVLQAAFREHHALQCGFCTPGILMSMSAFLAESPNPDDEEIRVALSGNICRCTGYQNILRAVKAAASRLDSSEGANERS